MSTHTERLATLMEDWRGDPVRFVRQAFGAKPDPWQADFMRAVASEQAVAVRSGHGPGKSTALAWIILWFAHTRRPFKVPVTGSNFDQLKATLWAEVGMWLRKMPAPLQKAWNYTTEGLSLLDAPEECFVALRTAAKDKSQNLAGFHSENVLVVVDEASAVDDLIFEVLDGALTGKRSKIVLAGNPVLPYGRFFRAFHKERALWKTFHVSSEDSPRVDRAWVEKQAASYGRDSNVYRIRVLGEFPTNDADGVIPLPLIEAAVNRPVARIQHVRPIWGVDVGGEPLRPSADIEIKNAASALAKRQANALLEPIKSWLGKNPTQLAGIVTGNGWTRRSSFARPRSWST